MSSPVRCDGCGKRGRRRMRFLAPEGWLYIEAHIDDAESDGFIVWACSPACATAMWKQGPGPLQDLSYLPEETE